MFINFLVFDITPVAGPGFYLRGGVDFVNPMGRKPLKVLMIEENLRKFSIVALQNHRSAPPPCPGSASVTLPRTARIGGYRIASRAQLTHLN